MGWKSMTGYGRAESELNGRVWSVEVRSVNNRFLDAKIKLPRDYGALEEGIRRRIGEFHQRGRVDLTLSVSGDFSDLVSIRFDPKIAATYLQALHSLAEHTGISSTIDLLHFANLPDILIREQHPEDLDAIAPFIDRAVGEALQRCLDMREKEALHLSEDLGHRLKSFTTVLQAIEEQLPTLISQREMALKERLAKLLDHIEIDPARLAQEVAIIADKTDVTEELVRLRSHIIQFTDLLQASDPVGRTLDFLIQEFLREVNTIASKINDAQIAHQTVTLKSELEKMREQIQNIE
ncbi:MAG: YicC family protein [Desulfofustis sp.]|nr:YicC family protein [Desulfofustis sp.]